MPIRRIVRALARVALILGMFLIDTARAGG